MDVSEQVRVKFVAICNKCKSSRVKIDFSAGDGQCPSPATGWLWFECENCGAALEVDGD